MKSTPFNRLQKDKDKRFITLTKYQISGKQDQLMGYKLAQSGGQTGKNKEYLVFPFYESDKSLTIELPAILNTEKTRKLKYPVTNHQHLQVLINPLQDESKKIIAAYFIGLTIYSSLFNLNPIIEIWPFN